MRAKRWVLALTTAALLLPIAAIAQGGPGQGGPGGNRPGAGRGMMFGMQGILEEIGEKTLTVRMMFGGGRPGGGQGGPGGNRGQGGNRAEFEGLPLQGGDQPQGRVLTVDLTDKTFYRDLGVGAEADLAEGVLLAGIGTENGDQFTAKALVTYKAPQGEDAMVSGRVLMMTGQNLRRAAGLGRDERPDMVFGTVASTMPLVVKARGRDGEREVHLTVSDATKFGKISVVDKGDLKVGKQVGIVPVQPQGQGGQGGNRATLPLQGGGPGQGGPPTRVTAVGVVQMPAPPQPQGQGGPPAQ